MTSANNTAMSGPQADPNHSNALHVGVGYGWTGDVGDDPRWKALRFLLNTVTNEARSDTNSCLPVISAKRRKIPVFHMEAGNRYFDQRVPEEINRKIVDHLSDINMVLTEHTRRYLIAEGINAETIIKTGSSMLDVLGFYQSRIEASGVLDNLGLADKDFLSSVLTAKKTSTRRPISSTCWNRSMPLPKPMAKE